MPRATDLRAAFQNSSPAARYRVGGGGVGSRLEGTPFLRRVRLANLLRVLRS